MSGIENILPYERELFLWLNAHHTSYWDAFMWICSEKLTWLPLALFCIFSFTYKVKWREAILVLISIGIVIFMCDYVVSIAIKPFFARPRPTFHPDFQAFVQTVNGYRGGRLGFISSHAANSFGIVTFISLILRYRYLTITAFLWALLMSYSRIYLGVHFVSDVVGGMIWGISNGILVYYVYLTSRNYILKVPKDQLKVPIISRKRANMILFVILSSVAFVAIYSGIFDITS